MTEPNKEEKTWPEGTITFRERQIRVTMPRPEQIMVWQRTMNKLQEANTSDWNGRDVLAALERTRKIIDSILKDQADADWLDDEMLAGRIGLKDASEIILEANRVFTNREQRREAVKKAAAPARRKKAS